MPIEIFVAAAIVNRPIAVPVLAVIAAIATFGTYDLAEHIGYITYSMLYGFAGWGTRHVLQAEIQEMIEDRRENRRLADQREDQAFHDPVW